MGNSFAKLFGGWFGPTKVSICMIGLDAAGKTTTLFKMKLGEVLESVPTIGFNVETVEYKNVSFTVWDVGGQNKIRRLWHHYYANVAAVIYVVDSSDTDRMKEARDELHAALSDDRLRNASLLVLANKQDLPRALPTAAISDQLNLSNLRGRDWYIQSCCAVSGEGLYEGLDWLSANVKAKKR
eukprot:Rmarinus@m.21067